jgi:hypothetical protein
MFMNKSPSRSWENYDQLKRDAALSSSSDQELRFAGRPMRGYECLLASRRL